LFFIDSLTDNTNFMWFGT